MQTHYFEIKAIPHEELPQSAVTSLALQDLHSVLTDFDGKVGLSFPDYKKQIMTLGGRIRCFASFETLESIKLKLLGKDINDYAIISNIHEIPKQVPRYFTYSRVQNKGTSDLKRIKKAMQRRGKSEAEIQKVLELRIQKLKPVTLPHAHINSASTGQRFLLMINRKPAPMKSEGLFSSYGLSPTSTVPDF